MANPKLNVELGVSGINQFKSAMTQGRTAVKTLDAELKLNAAQFKNSGDKEEYLRKRTELLNKQIQEQEKVVKAAQDALEKMAEQGAEKSSAAYQKMQEQVAKAQTELVNMRSELSEGSETMGETSSAADELADRLASIDKKVTFNAVLQGLKAVKDVASSVVNTITNGIKGAWNAMSEAAQWADTLATTAAQYGTDEKTIQAMQYASRFVDVDYETLLKAWNKIIKLKSENGVTYLSEDYAMQALSGDMLDQVFQVLDVLGQITDETERATIAQSIFGKSWNELQPAFGQKDEYYRRMAEAEEKGYIVDEERVKSLTRLSDAQEELDAAWDSFLLNIAGDFAPMFEEFVAKLIELLNILHERMQSEEWQALIQRIMDSILNVVEFLSDPDTVNALLDKFEALIEKLGKVLGFDFGEWVEEHTTQPILDAGDSVNPYFSQYMTGVSANPTKGYSSPLELAKEYGIDAPYYYDKDTKEYRVDEAWLAAQGQELAENYTEGIIAEAENARAAGEYVGSEAVAGVASAAGSGSNVYNNDSTFIDTVNINGGSPENVYEQLAKENGKARAGVGS